MSDIFQKRFQLQLLFALVAAISVAALTVELVLNAVRHAEGFVLADTKRALNQAIQELDREYRLRRSDDSTWAELPSGAQDLYPARHLSNRARLLSRRRRRLLAPLPVRRLFLPHSRWRLSQNRRPRRRTNRHQEVIRRGPATGQSRDRPPRQTRPDRHLRRLLPGPVAAWAMKRLPGQAELARNAPKTSCSPPSVAAALLGAAGVLATGIGLQPGHRPNHTSGSPRCRSNFSPGLPDRRDELGQISAAINEMARTRRRLEAEVRREDRARTIGRLVGRIAHEMRNPLNSIRLSLQMLAATPGAKPPPPADFQMVIE